jgi:hypothetical protein
MVCLVPYALDKMGSCSPRLTKTQTIYHLLVLSLNGYIFRSLVVTQILGCSISYAAMQGHSASGGAL